MKDRIRLLMESQHMTQQTFANFIGMAPGTLSSIFNDRTRPTINIVEAIKKKLPDVSTDWLMFGNGPMYNSPSSSENSLTPDTTGNNEPSLNFESSTSPLPDGGMTNRAVHNPNILPEGYSLELKKTDKHIRQITEIRVYFDDQTWESFVPSK